MKLKLINGNDHEYLTDDIKIVIKQNLTEFLINHIKRSTGLKFTNTYINGWAECKPKTATQIVRLLTMASTYCFVVAYSNNWSAKSTIYLGYQDRKQNECL